EDLRRGPVTVCRRQYVVTQLPLGSRAEFIELLGRRFELRLARREFLQLFPERVGNRKVLAHEIVVKLDRALNLIRLKTCNATSGQLEGEREEHVSQLSLSSTDR